MSLGSRLPSGRAGASPEPDDHRRRARKSRPSDPVNKPPAGLEKADVADRKVLPGEVACGETIRFIKQSYGLEDIRLFPCERL